MQNDKYSKCKNNIFSKNVEKTKYIYKKMKDKKISDTQIKCKMIKISSIYIKKKLVFI